MTYQPGATPRGRQKIDLALKGRNILLLKWMNWV